jgi:hypothetical protein
MDSAQISDGLGLQRCHGCRYRLLGLSESGVCPECGEPYDASTIELIGVAYSARRVPASPVLNQWIRKTAAWLPIAAVFIWIAWKGIWVALAPMVALIPHWGEMALLRLRINIAGQVCVCVRLNHAGIVQDNNAEEPPIISTCRTAWYGAMAAAVAGVCGWGLMNHTIMPLILAAVFALIYGCAWLEGAMQRRAILRLPDGYRLLPAAGRVTLRPRRWVEVDGVEITTLNEKHCRIRIRALYMRLGFDAYVVDAEVRCTAEQTAALRARVRAWHEYWRNVKDAAAADSMR